MTGPLRPYPPTLELTLKIAENGLSYYLIIIDWEQNKVPKIVILFRNLLRATLFSVA